MFAVILDPDMDAEFRLQCSLGCIQRTGADPLCDVNISVMQIFKTDQSLHLAMVKGGVQDLYRLHLKRMRCTDVFFFKDRKDILRSQFTAAFACRLNFGCQLPVHAFRQFVSVIAVHDKGNAALA